LIGHCVIHGWRLARCGPGRGSLLDDRRRLACRSASCESQRQRAGKKPTSSKRYGILILGTQNSVLALLVVCIEQEGHLKPTLSAARQPSREEVEKRIVPAMAASFTDCRVMLFQMYDIEVVMRSSVRDTSDYFMPSVMVEKVGYQS